VVPVRPSRVNRNRVRKPGTGTNRGKSYLRSTGRAYDDDERYGTVTVRYRTGPEPRTKPGNPDPGPDVNVTLRTYVVVVGRPRHDYLPTSVGSVFPPTAEWRLRPPP